MSSSSPYSNSRVGMRARPSPYKTVGVHQTSEGDYTSTDGVRLHLTPEPLEHQTRPLPSASSSSASSVASTVSDNGAYDSSAHSTTTPTKRNKQTKHTPNRNKQPSRMYEPTIAASSSAATSAFSSFLLSPAYHAAENELRTDGTVDLSRRSGGGMGRERWNKKQSSSIHNVHDHAHQEHDHEHDADEDKGDYAIVIRLESKVLKQSKLMQALETQPPSIESSIVRSSQDTASPPNASPTTERRPSAMVDASATTPGIHRVDLLSDAALQSSLRLRTLTRRLAKAGLKWTREGQIVDGAALLKIHAPSEVLEHAAWRLRLKMPLKPVDDVAATAGTSGRRGTIEKDEAKNASTATQPAASTTTASSSSPSTPFYTYLPFDPSIRDQFLGTPDPSCIFRSSERQILLDFILRSDVSQGGCGLGNQVANELERRRKLKAKRKEKELRRKLEAEKLAQERKRTSGAPITPPATQSPASVTPDVAEDASSSDDDDSSLDGDASSSSEVAHIEQHILCRFPLHSSRLDALDHWISYWQLRTKLGASVWISGLFSQPLDSITFYFGQEVGFYFAFMQFYCRALIIPSIIGGVLFLVQLSVSNIDTPLLPFFSLFFAIWSSILIEVWKRRENSLAWLWGSFQFEKEDELTRPEFEGELRKDAITGEQERVYPLSKRLLKVSLSSTLWLTILIAFGFVMIHLFSNWDGYVDEVKKLDTNTGPFSLDMLFVPCLWGILIPILDYIFSSFALRLTNWENWKLGSTFRALFIAKVFSFRFINAFLALYYYMFSSSSGLVRLTTSVASFMIIGATLRFFLGVFGPAMEKKWNGWRARRRARNAGATAAESHAEQEEPQLSQAWLESTYPEYDYFEDYTNMAIQFGYVCFFSVAFPFAPLCALINNLIMVRVGAYKLCRLTRRPLSCKSSGLGIWLSVLQLMSIIAVLTNCALIGLTSLQLSSWFPELSISTKILLIFAFEHAILLLKIVIAFAIPDVTQEVEVQRKKEKHSMNQANTELMELRRKQIVFTLLVMSRLIRYMPYRYDRKIHY